MIEDNCTAFERIGYDGSPFTAPEIGVLDMPKIFRSHQHGNVGLVKQLLDHTMAPTAAGGYTRFAIEKMTVLTNIAIIHKAKHPGTPIALTGSLNGQDVDESNLTVVRLEAERAALAAELAAMRNSTSWRVTRPLRQLTLMMQRL